MFVDMIKISIRFIKLTFIDSKKRQTELETIR